MPWLPMAAAAAVITALLLGAWELEVRRLGFGPSLDDTPELWARARRRLDDQPGGVVLIGDSRMLFDLDLDGFEAATGGRPVQLAIVGSNPLLMLEHLAATEGFHGTVISSVTPELYFLPPGAGGRFTRANLERYRRGSIAQRLSFQLWLPLDRRLAFLEQDELRLPKLIEAMELPQREGVDATFLPYLYRLDDERRARLFEKVETDAALRAQIRAAWMSPRPPEPEPPALAAALRESGRQATLWRARAAVDQIRSRGGRVVYVRFPSSGDVLADEKRRFPRRRYWDLLLDLTGAPGVHFEDHPELVFDCPEWSHLTAGDSVEFTRRLMPYLLPHLGP
jgi:hypothetical protein